MPWEGLHPAGDPNQYVLQGEHPAQGSRIIYLITQSSQKWSVNLTEPDLTRLIPDLVGIEHEIGHFEEGTVQCGHHCRDYIGKEIQK